MSRDTTVLDAIWCADGVWRVPDLDEPVRKKEHDGWGQPSAFDYGHGMKSTYLGVDFAKDDPTQDEIRRFIANSMNRNLASLTKDAYTFFHHSTSTDEQ
jgi:hypothetical protein